MGKFVEVKRQNAVLRKDRRKMEESLKAEVETYKRRANDHQQEAQKYMKEIKKYKSDHTQKYHKQFQIQIKKIKDIEMQRNTKETELGIYQKKNRELMGKLNKTQQQNDTLKKQYEKLWKQYDIKIKSQQTTNNNSDSKTILSQNKKKKTRKRKLNEIENNNDDPNNPKKKMKLSLNNNDMEESNNLNEDILRMSLNDNNEESILSPYNDSYRCLQFKDKSSMIQYEMERISIALIDKMSDPVEELGKFIQSLSVNTNYIKEDDDSLLFLNGYKMINEQRQKWQSALCENWYLSKQTKSLIPLIRFLYQILSPPDFNHIFPMLSGVRILRIVLDGDDGKLYRNLLFESITKKNNKYKQKKKKKKEKKEYK